MLQSPFKYFDRAYCINLDSRPDRWRQCIEEFKREDISVERFPAITGQDKTIAFNQSQLGVIQKAISDKAGNAVVFEDDVVLKNVTHLHYAMNELPQDWDLLYLGGNIIGIDIIPFRKPIRYSAHLFTLIDCWQTHAVAYSEKALRYVAENFKADNGYIYDEWLRHHMLPNGKSFIIAPQIAYQRKSKSDIWNVDADFEHLFEQGNKLLTA